MSGVICDMPECRDTLFWRSTVSASLPKGIPSSSDVWTICWDLYRPGVSFHLSLFSVAQWLSGKPLTNYWCKFQIVQDGLGLPAYSIPGPIEVADEVLFANAHPSMSHVSPEFVPVFGDCIRMIRYASSALSWHWSPILIQRGTIHKRRSTVPYQWERNSRLGPSQSISSILFHDLNNHQRYLQTLLNQAKMHSYFTAATLEIALLIGVSLIHKLVCRVPHRSLLYWQVSTLMAQPLHKSKLQLVLPYLW